VGSPDQALPQAGEGHINHVEKQVEKVEEKTNGSMEEQIKEGVRQVLAEYGVTPGIHLSYGRTSWNEPRQVLPRY
jgi:hypothetical protein